MKCFKLKEHELASSVGQDKTIQHKNASVMVCFLANLNSLLCFLANFILYLNFAVEGDVSMKYSGCLHPP